MDIKNLTSTSLRGLLKLTETRDSLLAELKKVEDIIAGALLGKKAPAAAAKPGKKRGRKASKVAAAKPASAKKSKSSGRRGALKEKIIAALKKSGAKGVSVKDLSKDLGVKSANVHVWFATTGKKVGVAKVSPGVYRLK